MDSRRRVLFIIHSLSGGGAERVFVQLVNGLDRQRFVPVLALGDVEGPYVTDVRSDVEMCRLGATRARTAVPAIVRLVRAVRPHTVVSTAGLNFAVALARPVFPRGTRVILREANSVSAFLADVGRTQPIRAWVYAASYRFLYPHVDAVLCQSAFMATDLARRVRSARLVTLPNPVDVDRITALAAAGEPVFSGSGPHLVAMGRCAYQKGYDIVLRAMAIARQRYPNLTLTVLGDGALRGRLEAAAGQSGLGTAVRFLGFQGNPYPWLRGADLFVSASRYEGSSNALLEALACGTPVVATDCPSANREVLADGRWGRLAPPEDAEALAEAICTALAHPEDAARAARRAWVAQQFGIGRMMREFEAHLAGGQPTAGVGGP